MCGIAAVINGDRSDAIRMGRALKHRGIAENYFDIDNLKVFFSYLPITDQSAPMQPYQSRRYVIWMNGYISNYKELAAKHKFIQFTNCDTEVLSAFIEKFNLDRLDELNGFFAVLVYDRIDKKIHTFTDRYGIKQLYRYERNGKTYIASEIKSLLAVEPLEIHPGSADEWIYSLGVMNENTIYEGVERVARVPAPVIKPISISYTQAKEQLLYLLNQSIQRNRVQSLKAGVFLSGGVDSGTLANRMSPDYCFSMDYQDESFSEIQNIKRNTAGIHHTLICTPRLFDQFKYVAVDALDDLKAGSCYTNFALTETASKFCRVLYSGAGGDEVFDGYVHRYDRPINDVIRRTLITDPCAISHYYPPDLITHKYYDWAFLRAILVVEDRMSGYHTMETRYPLLDNDFVNFALSLPAEYRTGKRILKDISGLAPEVVDGKKRGFSNPYMTNYQWATFALRQKQKPK